MPINRSGPHKPTITHPLNRFGGNMGPYADALLPLQSVDYINASPIDNLGEGAMPFVATMCPKRETFAHFWSMVWELGSRVIVNLTHEKDRVGSGPGDKRERYWPPLDEPSERQMARWPVRPYTIGTESCEQVRSLLRFTIELHGPRVAGAASAAGGGSNDGRPRRIVYLYWYSQWVDFPSSTSIGSRPFYANAWAVLHIGMHIAAELAELAELGPVRTRALPRTPTRAPSAQNTDMLMHIHTSPTLGCAHGHARAPLLSQSPLATGLTFARTRAAGPLGGVPLFGWCWTDRHLFRPPGSPPPAAHPTQWHRHRRGRYADDRGDARAPVVDGVPPIPPPPSAAACAACMRRVHSPCAACFPLACPHRNTYYLR